MMWGGVNLGKVLCECALWDLEATGGPAWKAREAAKMAVLWKGADRPTAESGLPDDAEHLDDVLRRGRKDHRMGDGCSDVWQ